MSRTIVCGDILLDDEDKHLLDDYTWGFKDGKYPRTRISNKNVYIHHLILNTNQLIDHIDRNPLNNKKSNLRFSNKSKNAMNSKLRKDNTSGIKGVSWNNNRKKWEVYISINNKKLNLGRFKNLKQAVLKRIENEKLYFKENANQDLIKLNLEKYG